MNKTTLTCDNCGFSFERETKEFKRSQSRGRKNFCSRKCAGVNNLKNFGDKRCTTPPPHRKPGYGDPFNYILRNCRRRNYDLDVSQEDLKEIWENQKGLCPYSGVKLVLRDYRKNNRSKTMSASLDRIDSSKGYIKGNVQFVSLPINYMKHTMSHEETVEFCKKISDFWK